MNYRQLGGSGLKIPDLTFGAGAFGGSTEFFKAWGATDVAEATRLVDICLEAGLTMFDSADVYSTISTSNNSASATPSQPHNFRPERPSDRLIPCKFA